MITRIIAIDPRPRDLRDDVILYQVPEKSRAYELLVEMLDAHGIEHVEVGSAPRKKKDPVRVE